MKKILSVILALTILFTFSSSLLANETNEEVETEVTETTVETDDSEETDLIETSTDQTDEITDETEETSEVIPPESGETEKPSETELPVSEEETEPTTTTVSETEVPSEETTIPTEVETTVPEETTTENTTTTEKQTEPSEPSTRKGPVKAPSVRATVNYLTYENGSYYYIDDMSDPDAVPTAHSSFPYRGDFVLGGDIEVSAQITPDVLTIDLNGYDIIDNYNNTKPLISVQQDDIFTLKDSVGTGRIYSNNLQNHTCVYLNNGGTFNFEGGTIEHFTTNENGGGINIWHKNDIVRMSGNATVKDCTTTNKSGGGGINVFRGKLYMSDSATVTGCKNVGAGGEKQGNGAGVHVGNGGTLYITDNVQIVNNTGTGYHGAGIDLWSDSFMYLSGSPTILNNINGKGYPCNLYIGSVVNIDGPLTGNPHDISITIQTDPIFTHNLTASNPGRPIEELLELFDADKFYWTDLPRHDEYTIIDHNGIEAKQAPVILVHFDQNHDNLGDWKVVEDVPGGYATNPGNPPARTGYNFNGWYRNANGTGSAFDFKNTNLPHEDFYLYAKWSPKTYNITINIIKDGTTTTTTTTAAHDSTYSNVFTADQYYRYTSIKIDNVEQLTDPETSYTVTIPNIAGAHTITLTEVKYQAVVTFNVTVNGFENQLLPISNQIQTVTLGDDATFDFALNDGYYIERMYVDGVEVTYTDSVTITNVQQDTVVELTVGQMYYVTITYDGYVDQVVSTIETSRYVIPGSGIQFTVVTQVGYKVEEVIIDGVQQQLSEPYDNVNITVNNITADTSIAIKISKVEVVPSPTGVILTVAPIIAVFIVVLIVLIIIKIRNKK